MKKIFLDTSSCYDKIGHFKVYNRTPFITSEFMLRDVVVIDSSIYIEASIFNSLDNSKYIEDLLSCCDAIVSITAKSQKNSIWDDVFKKSSLKRFYIYHDQVNLFETIDKIAESI